MPRPRLSLSATSARNDIISKSGVVKTKKAWLSLSSVMNTSTTAFPFPPANALRQISVERTNLFKNSFVTSSFETTRANVDYFPYLHQKRPMMTILGVVSQYSDDLFCLLRRGLFQECAKASRIGYAKSWRMYEGCWLYHVHIEVHTVRLLPARGLYSLCKSRAAIEWSPLCSSRAPSWYWALQSEGVRSAPRTLRRLLQYAANNELSKYKSRKRRFRQHMYVFKPLTTAPKAVVPGRRLEVPRLPTISSSD